MSHVHRPFSKYAELWPELRRHANKDRYLICNLPRAVEEFLGISSSSARDMILDLVQMGCLKKYVSKQPRKNARFTIYQLTGTAPTEELHHLHVVEPMLAKRKPADK